NGDGLADLALGAMDAEFQQTVIALFAGNEDGPSATPLWTMNGSAFDDAELFGFSLAGAGDVNGDGFADLAVFATLPDSDAIAHLRVFHGGEEGLAPVPDWQLENLAPLEGVVGMAGVGDVNGDGFADFLVGEPGFPAGERLGKVTLYAGSPTGLASVPIWTHVGVDAGAGLGMAVAGLGDVNGDDVPDFAYSAPGSGAAGGVVTIVLVDPAELDASTVVTLPARPDARYCGVLLDGVGDVNADGFADFVVGHAAGDSFAHPVWSLFLGGADGPSPTPAYDLTNATTGELLVFGSVNGGDLNGDGYSDFAVGEADFGALGTTQGESGHVAVYLGGPSIAKATSASARPANVQTDTVEDDEAGDVQPDGLSAGVDAAPVLDVLVDRLNVRSGPGVEFPVVAQADTGARFAVEGQADECRWLLVRDVDGNRGWLSADAQFVRLETPCAELEPIERRALDDAPSE
ncbi:MAG: FG-GAP repeat protein, partial [Caldilineaceae bacterium]|nr:FG-GAP repeat protein [Caldilineaceae bacterium]